MENSDKRTNRPRARQSIAHLPSSRSNGVDKQNVTIDISAARNIQESNPELLKKRTRGKSLGPGGLEALAETDGNIIKITPALQLRSILKPTVPLTPPKSIPTFDELRQRSTRKKSPAKNNTEALLIDFSTPGPSRSSPRTKNAISSNLVADPFSPFKANNSKIESETQKHDEVDDEEQVRQEQKKAVLEARAARRKSMANRRVSFAPEATLHTWSVMEMMEDSTTSSASNSTRRQSSMTAQSTPRRSDQSPAAETVPSDPPSTPPEQTEEPLVKASPTHQRDLHQQKRRRSSAMSMDSDASSDDIYSSSPSGDVAADSSPIRVEDSVESDSDTDGDTAMSMDEMTQNTIHSEMSGSSTHSSLEERLRLAAAQAGTRGIEYDEYGDDVSMEIAPDTVTTAFQPWARNQQQQPNALEDQENSDPFSPAKRAQGDDVIEEEDQADTTQGMTMEITRAIGGILGATNQSPKSRRKSGASRRRSSAGRRQSIAANSSYGDETMDFTTMAGGILSGGNTADHDQAGSDEEMTMEFTTAIGGLRSKDRLESTQSSIDDENESMDMTAAVGGILAPIEEQTEPQSEFQYEEPQNDDNTVAMEMTKGIGQILANGIGGTLQARQIMQEELDEPTQASLDEPGSLTQVKDEVKQSTPKHLAPIASETGSPSLAVKPRSSGRTRSARISQVSTPKSSTKTAPQNVSLIKEQSTPTKQLTPVPTRAKTPERTPLSANVTHRGASPKKLFQTEIKARSSPAARPNSAQKPKDPLFAQDELTGRQTPRVVLHAPKPHQHLRRRSSGIGIDQQGFGSPSVTQLLDRRASIGDAVPQFKLEASQPSRLRFEDPMQIAKELDAERAEDERRESGRFVMEQETNEQQEENVTLQLKDMIESMTPKKSTSSKFKGRKSLAVGSARGLLGKRPVELDDENEDGDSTPKRLKAVSREGSPVKKIHLPKPPSKEETTGRLTRTERQILESCTNGEHTPALDQSPSTSTNIGSPQHKHRYRDIPQNSSTQRPTSFENKLDNVIGAIDPSIQHPSASKDIADEEKISLQQFLNMTNIHFIELNTTKRRHTLAQSIANESLKNGAEHSNSTKSCFVAAATTMPLLELYQHATRELKSYISTGRKIIRTIESETLAEQPALFKEYVDARPDVKLVMDNQFRNGKANARLQSKEGWYTWRSQLVDGLQDGLQTLKDDLEKDFAVVQWQAKGLDELVPQLANHRDSLATELTTLQQRFEEIQSVDHHTLKRSRHELHSVNQELEDKLATLKTLQQQMQDKDEALSQAAELKYEMREQIKEAERVREEYRGWAVKDVASLKLKVEKTRNQTGWSLVSAEDDAGESDVFGVALTLNYKDMLRLFFYPVAYQQGSDHARRRSARSSRSSNNSTAPISLTYLPKPEDESQKGSLPTEQRFFLQLMQSQLHTFSMMPKGSVTSRMILDTVSSGWEMACKVSEELRVLNTAGIVRATIKGDERLNVKLMLVLSDKSRVDVEFMLTATILDNGNASATTSIDASAVYGAATKVLDPSKILKVQKALGKEIENKVLGDGAWIGAVQAFEAWHRAQPRPQKLEDKLKEARPVVPKEVAPMGSTTPKSPAPSQTKTPATRRSPLAAKKTSVLQKKIPVPTARQDRLRTSQREQLPPVEKTLVTVQDTAKEKENLDPFYVSGQKMPAITPEMQEAMMLQTPVKRVGALRRSPI